MLERLTPALGLFVLILIAWLASENRKRFPWRVVVWGLILQFVFCYLVLGVPALNWSGPLRFVFSAASDAVNATLDFTLEGSRFLFGSLLDTSKIGYILAAQVLPTIIFIGALMSVLYHLGIMQKICFAFAFIMKKSMGTSGAETLAAAANIFVGQTEAPLVIKPFVETMTRSELLCLMIGGMANTAGGVLAAYVGLLREQVPDIAGHLLTASVLSAPAAMLLSKVILPETTAPKTLGAIPRESEKSHHANVIDAAASGASEGLTLALNVMAMLIAFIALVALVNHVLANLGDWLGFVQWTGSPSEPNAKLTLQWLLGWIFAPLVWLVGVPLEEVRLAGSLMGEKTVLNEFVAYVHLAEQGKNLSPRTFVILSYALSGFANFSSMAIQIGGIAPLAPKRRGDLAQLGLRAVLGGTLATLMTAAVVAIVL